MLSYLNQKIHMCHRELIVSNVFLIWIVKAVIFTDKSRNILPIILHSFLSGLTYIDTL